MRLERRDGPSGPREERPSQGGKPVVVYIMVLFIAAFLLMALSFLMHQRSNSEALGALQSSVNGMQEVQSLQERVIQLQEELAEAKAGLEDAQSRTAELEREAERLRETLELTDDRASAFAALIALEQAYDAGDYEECRELIRIMEANGYPSRLEETGDLPYAARPEERYPQLKEAVEAAP